MRRWYMGCLFVVLLGLVGCESVDPPLCYYATLSADSPQTLPGLRIITAQGTVSVISTAAPTTTLMLSGLYFSNPRSYILAGQSPNRVGRTMPDRLDIDLWDIKAFNEKPVYPDCDQPWPLTSSAVLVATQGQRRQLVTLRVTFQPTDPELIAWHQQYDREIASNQRWFNALLVAFYLGGFLLFIGGVLLLIKMAKKLGQFD